MENGDSRKPPAKDFQSEAAVLASLSASLQEHETYEKELLNAHQLEGNVPTVTHIDRFPSLDSLGGSGEAAFQVLEDLHREQHGAPDDDLLYLQEQMLLCYLQNSLGVEATPFVKRESQREDSRRMREQEKAVAQRKRARVSMQQRRSQLVENAYEDEETKKQKKELIRLRKLRQEKRKQRRLLLDTQDDKSSSEEEFDSSPLTMQRQQKIDTQEVVSVDGSSDDEGLASDSGMVLCPLCQKEVRVSDGQVDESLSQHMDVCQRQRRSRRGTFTARDPLPKHEEQPAGESKPKKGRKRWQPRIYVSSQSKDDVDELVYNDRVDAWIETGLDSMKEMKERDTSEMAPGAMILDEGLYIPAWVNDHLFQYQREGLKWMWDLHRQDVGGLIGDEMGLGKTVQVCSFLGVLASSRKMRSVLIVAPATMLQHWLNELAIWAPGLRRILIHPSGETDGASRNISPKILGRLVKWLKSVRNDRLYEAIDNEDWDNMPPHSFCGTGYAVITTFENLRRNVDVYIQHSWGYVVLDEAQKIRNPDADITLACKRLRTPHRLAMSGTPIQNDLRELWSLFDFIYPGRLGTLPTFEQEFAVPIKKGGYSNASPMRVQMAYRCALMLRELVNPYLLRRKKKEIKEVSRMPSKTEHVLFCRLTKRQRAMYEAYISSDQIRNVLGGGPQLLAAITMCRKICNHPDLVCSPSSGALQSFVRTGLADQQPDSDGSDDSSVYDEESLTTRSGKLEVLAKILPLWNSQGHRVLIFCQWRKMLNIIQRFLMLKEWKFGRLDGNTNVSARQKLVDDFNNDSSYFALLCTTRTGGVGLNLTGANRIILYDPDFNPSTDAQARERAWRFGQEKEVTIYRLITAGTIEEKIYQRQIFKTALSNRILLDPKQRRLFSQRDLHDLFSLCADTGSVRSGSDGMTTTGKVTKGVGVLDAESDIVGDDSGENKDNQETLKSVLKSKGLAGVFDHHYLEEDPSRKSTTVREMEDRAKRIARKAAKALKESVEDTSRFDPTWTGSSNTLPARFGNESKFPHTAERLPGETASHSSSSILAGLRKQANDIKNAAKDEATISEDMGQYTVLLRQMKQFVSERSPSTDDILKKFESTKDCDVAILRRLLKSVARIENGRWRIL